MNEIYKVLNISLILVLSYPLLLTYRAAFVVILDREQKITRQYLKKKKWKRVRFSDYDGTIEYLKKKREYISSCKLNDMKRY